MAETDAKKSKPSISQKLEAVSEETTEIPIGYWALIRDYPNWRYLWFGQIVSLLGDWFNLIASATLLAQLTGSGLAIGALFVVRMLAPFLISPIAGVYSRIATTGNTS